MLYIEHQIKNKNAPRGAKLQKIFGAYFFA